MTKTSFFVTCFLSFYLPLLTFSFGHNIDGVCKYYSGGESEPPMVNPVTFISGSVEDVSSAYNHLRTIIERDGVDDYSYYYFVNDDYSTVTKYRCEKSTCDGRDILLGINTCFSTSGESNNCTPLAVVKNKITYCLLRARESGIK